jgi:hypothetical protein
MLFIYLTSVSLDLQCFAVRILVAPYDVMKHVHRVSRAVPGLVSTEELAVCHVLHFASAPHATSAARKGFHAGINALAYVAKYVLKIIVRVVPVNVIRGWISLK